MNRQETSYHGPPETGLVRVTAAELPPEITAYMELVERDEPRACPEQHALVQLIRRRFDEERLYIDMEKMGRYFSLEKYFPFRLFPWQRFVLTLWLCTYREASWEEGTPSCEAAAELAEQPSQEHVQAARAGELPPLQANGLPYGEKAKDASAAQQSEAFQGPQNGKGGRPVAFLPRWKTLFEMIARGSGKDGEIGFAALCVTSPFNQVRRYDVDICANDEVQAKRPLEDLVSILETPGQEAKLDRHFYHTKEIVQGRKNRGKIRGWTNNAKHRDGLRSGMIVFNEVHQFQDYKNINVFTSGLGKVQEPRIGIFSSNGKVNDGPLDDYLAQSRRILFEGEPDDGFLPFVCCLENRDQVKDPACWPMANPSWAYLPHLRQETADEYQDFQEHPERHGDFLSKRMGLRAGFSELAVTDYEKILSTNRPLPDMKGWSCAAGLDYAELSDWASLVLLFRRGEERLAICHTWICAESKTLHRVKAPWKAWVELGHCTLVHEPTIPPKLLGEWLQRAGEVYRIKKLAMDGYRWTLISDAMIGAGWDARDKNRVKLVRPSDIMKVEPVIQRCFDAELFTWGDYPPLRWATNNAKRIPASRGIGSDTGNFYFGKIEAKSRKTDPFMALVAAMTIEDAIPRSGPVKLPPAPFVIR